MEAEVTIATDSARSIEDIVPAQHRWLFTRRGEEGQPLLALHPDRNNDDYRRVTFLAEATRYTRTHLGFFAKLILSAPRMSLNAYPISCIFCRRRYAHHNDLCLHSRGARRWRRRRMGKLRIEPPRQA